jgi:hypothetical protein
MSEAFILRNRIELSSKGSHVAVHAAEKQAVAPGSRECTALGDAGAPECTAVADAGGRLFAALLAG